MTVSYVDRTNPRRMQADQRSLVYSANQIGSRMKSESGMRADSPFFGRSDADGKLNCLQGCLAQKWKVQTFAPSLIVFRSCPMRFNLLTSPFGIMENPNKGWGLKKIKVKKSRK